VNVKSIPTFIGKHHVWGLTRLSPLESMSFLTYDTVSKERLSSAELCHDNNLHHLTGSICWNQREFIVEIRDLVAGEMGKDCATDLWCNLSVTDL
jgi:hypothetical protein